MHYFHWCTSFANRSDHWTAVDVELRPDMKTGLAGHPFLDPALFCAQVLGLTETTSLDVGPHDPRTSSPMFKMFSFACLAEVADAEEAPIPEHTYLPR